MHEGSHLLSHLEINYKTPQSFIMQHSYMRQAHSTDHSKLALNAVDYVERLVREE